MALMLLGSAFGPPGATPPAFQYYILNPHIQDGPLQVMSLADGNRIRVDDVELRLDRYARDTISAGAELAPGTRITGTGPFTVRGEAKGTDLPVPGLFAGTEFVIPHQRDHHFYYLLSPHGEARVEILMGYPAPMILTLPEGEMVVFDAGSDNLRAGILSSDHPILVEHAAFNGPAPRDVYPVPPVSRELWGIRSNTAVVAAKNDDTTVWVYASNGASGRYTLDAGEKRTITIGDPGAQGAGDALRIVADKPVAAIQVADGDGLEATAFLDRSYLGTRHGIPVDSQYLAVACPEQGTSLSLRNGNELVQELSCDGAGDDAHPGKAYFGSAVSGAHIPAGAYLESNHPVHVYQEIQLFEAEHNLLGHQDRYFILEDRSRQAPMNVVSLADGNQIQAGSHSLFLDRHRQGVIPAGDDLRPGAEIRGSGPFALGGELAGTDLPVPGTFAGLEFVIPHHRNRHVYSLLSPYGDARVEIRLGGAAQTIDLPQGQVVEYEAGEDNAGAAIVRASRPVLITHTAYSGNNPRDVYPVPPAANALWGIRSNTVVVGALLDDTTIQVYASDGTSTSQVLQAGEKRDLNIGASGSQGTGSAVHIRADKPVAAIQVADGDGLEATAFLGMPYLGMHYAIPVDTQYLAVVCPEPDTHITLMDGGPSSLQEQACSGDGLIPGKAYFGATAAGTHIRAGAVLESSRPVYLIQEVAASNGERNLLGIEGTLSQAAWLSITAPLEGAFTNQPRPSVELAFGPKGSGLDTGSLELFAAGQPLTITCEFAAATASCVPNDPLTEGEVRLEAAIYDFSGQRFEAEPVVFTLDRTRPEIRLDSPAHLSWVNDPVLLVTGQISEAAEMRINGAMVAMDPEHRFSHTIELVEGTNGILVTAYDTAGNFGLLYQIVYLDTVPPPPVEGGLVRVSEPAEGQVSVSGEPGSVETDSNVQVTNLDTGDSTIVAATGEGGFSAILVAQANQRLAIAVLDQAGNQSVSWETRVPGGTPGSLPPDPSTIAPPLDPTVATSLYDATAFLYSGANPIQQDVVPGTIEERRAAVLRGQVRTRDGTPLSGVTIRIQDHDEFGHTLSRADGMFDIVVNGGGWLTVRYEREGYLPVQRQIRTPWQEYAWLPDVVMIGLDARVTSVDLTSGIPIQTARGSSITDADGSRQATILFPQDTQAELVLPNGSIQPLGNLNVRATEYSVGENGPAAMPGELPPASGYTYAVELSVDEAIAAGAKEVRFNRPLPFYLENFLDFPVGGIVPAGWYDRERLAWIPSDNGRIIQVISVTSGMADLDVDGSGNPADATALAELGISDDERRELAVLYVPGQSLWRVPVAHFTPWDLNWPMGAGDDARKNEETIPEPDEKEEDPDCENGSIIECQNQVLGEMLAVTGSPFSLHYRSDHVTGRKSAYTLRIPLSGTEVPPSLKRIELEISVAGQKFNQVFPPLPDQTMNFIWNGRDAFGRVVQGARNVTVRVDYVYPGVYYEPQSASRSFSMPGGTPIAVDRQRGEVTLWQDSTRLIGVKDARGMGLGAWGISPHHAYDPHFATLYRGNGTSRNMRTMGPVITTFAGTGQWDFSGDGGPAVEADLRLPNGVTVAPDGALYIADRNNNRIRKVDLDGIITTVAGNGGAFSWAGDGGPAIDAVVDGPTAVAIGNGGELYIAESDGNRIRRVGRDGMISTIAGSLTHGFSGDGGPASEAQIDWPSSLVVAADGSIYFSDAGNDRVRRIGPDGIITTVAGNGEEDFSGDGGPATDASLYNPFGLALGDDGSLYISDATNHRIRKVRPDGIITTIAGNGSRGFVGDGGPALDAAISFPRGIHLDDDGSLYFADSGNLRVRRIWPDGIITTVAGNGEQWFGGAGDGGLAAEAQFASVYDVAIDRDGSLYCADATDSLVRRIAPQASESSDLGHRIASEDGSDLYVFDGNGRHLRTENTLTGSLRHRFEYDTNGYLIGIEDLNGEILRIDRQPEGTPTAIVTRDEQRTEFTLDANGYLATITNPATETHFMSYGEDGLLMEYTDPDTNTSRYHYDTLGRLIETENAAGGGWLLSRMILANGYESGMTSAEGLVTRYRVERPTGGGKLRTNHHPDGTMRITRDGAGGRRTVTVPDGTTIDLLEGPDPRFGMFSPVPESRTVTTPDGLVFQETTMRATTLEDENDPLSHLELIETVTRNGRISTNHYTAGDRTWLYTTPVGRKEITVLDEQGRVTQQAQEGLLARTYGYDVRGRLEEILQAPNTPEERRVVLGYDSAGWLASITDPLSRTLRFAYDDAGRVTLQTLPDGREVGYRYDPNGNLSALIPPGRDAHLFSYTPVNLEEEYRPPELSGVLTITRYHYNLDKQLTRIERPDGRALSLDYDSGGRLEWMTLERGQYHYQYHPGTGRLSRITSPDGGSLDLAWDGFLPLGESWSGDIAGTVSRGYDNNFWVTSQAVNGDALTFGYDDDGLLTSAGGLTITRDPGHGLPTASLLDAIATTRDYNDFGEPSRDTTTLGNDTVLDITYTRDRLGRIEELTEMIDGVTTTHVYGYDPAGRLVSASRGGATTAWTYDSSGNRTHVNDILVATYDEQDRLLTHGSASYTHTANGELESRTEGGATTRYDYDELGNLLKVILPGDVTIDYLVDGRNRRIGKIIDGTLVQGFLYQDQLNPVAELDGSGNVIARFVYADKPNVPAYMIKAGITYRILSDHLGSPRLIVNAATGEIAQRLDYDVWGNILLDTNPGFQPFGFAGGIHDQHTGLVRFGARDYDPVTGRWTRKDPIRFYGGEANLYGYALSDPINFFDLDGLNAFAITTANMGGSKSGDGSSSLGIGATIGTTTIGFNTSDNNAQWGQTTQLSLGIGVEFCFNRATSGNDCNEEKNSLPDNYSLGSGKHLGIKVNVDGSFCINFGPSWGLPAGAGWDL